MTEPETVGELDGDTWLWTIPNSTFAHTRETCDLLNDSPRTPKRKRAAILFDDRELCRDCTGVAENGRGGGNQPMLPKSTEVTDG